MQIGLEFKVYVSPPPVGPFLATRHVDITVIHMCDAMILWWSASLSASLTPLVASCSRHASYRFIVALKSSAHSPLWMILLVPSQAGMTALRWASGVWVITGHLEVVKALITNGADVNAKDNVGGGCGIMLFSYITCG